MTRVTGLRRFAEPPSFESEPRLPLAGGQPVAGQPGRPSYPSLAGRPGATPGEVRVPGVAAAPGTLAGQPQESCEMCATTIAPEHGHVADLDGSALRCACRSCYLLFTSPEAGRGRYRAVPDRYLCDLEHPMSGADWDDLEIPVGLAFFLQSSRQEQVTGFYPSPAGVTECRLDLTAWQRIAAGHPLLTALAPDVEAALICRTGDRVEHFLVPIDACYELAGRMRLHWRGFDGGTQAHEHVADFLASVRSRARPLALEA